MSAEERAAEMYPESDMTYGYQAVREAFEYGWQAALSDAAAPEPEWEYGATHIHPEKPASICGDLDGAREAQAFYDREIARHGHGDCSHLFRRTKAIPAGPWEPLPVGGED